MSIRNKLIMMLAIPLAALALVGALGFRGQSAAANAASSALADDGVVQGINTAIKAIGAERLAVVANAPGEELAEVRAATDASLATAAQTAAAQNLPGVQAAVTNASNLLIGARSEASLMGQVVEMNDATDELRSVRGRVDVDYPSPDSFAEATSIDLTVDIADRQDAIWLEYIAADEVSADLADRLSAEIVATELLRDQVIQIAPESHIAPLNASMASDADADMERAGIEALARFERGEAPLGDGPTLDAVIASHLDWYGHAVMLQDDVRANLAQRATDAESRQNLFALLGTLGLLVLFGLIYVVYRSVVRPLNDLLDGAELVASDKLPSVVSELRTIGSSDANVSLDPLPRQTDDELGSLVDAFNDVQLTAFDLAVEQARSRRNIAEMFVNLGRRNQKLLQRMLNVLSDLEQDEKDGDKLERLFELDHMTTRMRRNAESLLVVAGTKTPRQWAKPVPAADVVRSALAEVQDYQRVDVASLAEAPMAGNAVTDVTHLLAELLENSLQFSDPDARVTVSARWHDEGYRIVIADQGFGMSDEELAEHNSLIANPPPPDQAPTRFLGLFVVGHLAARHGIEVVLSDGTIAGTDARITIPASVMSDAADPTKARVVAETDDSGLDAHLASDIDFDAELSKLTAEAAARTETEIIIGDLPVRGQQAPSDAGDADAAEINLTDLPTRSGDSTAPATGEPAPELPQRGAAEPFMAEDPIVVDEPTSELPAVADHMTEVGAPASPDGLVEAPAAATNGADDAGVDNTSADNKWADSMWIDPSEMITPPAPTPAPAPPTPEAAAPAPAPFSAAANVATEAAAPAAFDDRSIDFSRLPEPPSFTTPAAPATAAAPAAPEAMATAPIPQAAPAAPLAPTGDTGLGLPTRVPRAALEEQGGLGASAPAAEAFSAATAPVPTPDAPAHPTTDASTISSQFSAFQAGIQRSEEQRG